jgi:hypothetical protein
MQAGSGCTMVIVAYKPKPGKEADLLELTREHVPLLRAEGLATDHPVTACQAKDGTVVEVFEWVDGGVQRAHTNPVVHRLWERYAAACDIVPLTTLPEASINHAARSVQYVRILHSSRSLSKELFLARDNSPLRWRPSTVLACC